MRFVKYWLPLLIWVGVIFLGSTDLMSAEHTSRFIVPFLRWLKPDISRGDACVDSLHSFGSARTVSEYAVLGLLCFARGDFDDESQAVATDSLYGVVWVVCLFVAATDEFHQTLASRPVAPRQRTS